MIKEKKCKGEGQAKNFGCEKLTPVEERKFGLGKRCGCWHAWLMETDPGKVYVQKAMMIGKKNMEKSRIKEAKEERAKTKKEKDDAKDWAAELQVKINWITRMIDVGLLCLARGYGGQMQAGHIFARGGNSSMKFHLHNIHRQCAQSNHNQNDDGLLREGLAREYGQNYLDYVANLRCMKTLDFENWEYHELYKKACKIGNKMQKENLYYSREERIQKRNEINLELGIYDQRFCEFKDL